MMDCPTTRMRLEAVLPDSADLDPAERDLIAREILLSDDPEFTQAAAHLRTCPACRAVVGRRRRLDREISQAMRDVRLPEGLKERLLAAVAHTERPDPQPLALPPAQTTPAARRLRRLIASLAACALFTILGWSGYQLARVSPLELNQIISQVTLDAVSQAESAAVPVAPLPRMMQLPQGLRGATPRRLLLSNQQAVDAYPFVIRGHAGGTVEACLLVIPLEAVESPPSETVFLQAPAVYRNRMSSTAWVEENRLYICFVVGHEADLRQLVPSHTPT